MESPSNDEEKNALRVFCLDDDADHAYLLKRVLQGMENYAVALTHFERPEQMIVALQGDHPDILFLDHELHAARTGLDVLTFLRNADYDDPIIMMTNRDDEATLNKYLRFGADAFVSKGGLTPREILSSIQIALMNPHRLVPKIHKDSSAA